MSKSSASPVFVDEDIEKELPVHEEDVQASEHISPEDTAAQVLQHAGHVDYTLEEEKKILRKIDLHVLRKSSVDCIDTF